MAKIPFSLSAEGIFFFFLASYKARMRSAVKKTNLLFFMSQQEVVGQLESSLLAGVTCRKKFVFCHLAVLKRSWEQSPDVNPG